LEGFFNGDGCEQGGTISYYTSSKRLADDLHRLIILSGQWGTLNVRPSRRSLTKDGRVISGKHPEYGVSQWKLLQYSIERKKQVKIVKYSGFVYCAEVNPYHTLITRRNGRVLISGNCTANALAGNLEFLDKQADGAYTDVSRLFIYFNERVLQGNTDADSGASLRNGIKTLVNNGACSESAWPYNIEKFADKPSERCYADGLEHRIVSYHRIMNIDEMLACLSEGFPFVFGFAVYESLQTPLVARTGKVPMPKKSERMLGGHAVMAVGYDQKEKRFLVRNSWGEGWGMGGYFTIPFAYLETLASDFWTIRK
jgi:C1A family cysteine protease